MCDTVAIRREDAILFAKNSDREPREAQRVERHEAVVGDTAGTVRCTYIEIAQVPDRHATILCRPDWMWGAEMGVNAAGVAIGNEAVFSRTVMRKGEALLGMDLVRLGLERGGSAHEAAAVIIHLLETYGQGGPAGHRDKRFRYDNAFLIADAAEILVLETCGRDWLLKRYPRHAAISNCYSISGAADMASGGAPADGFAPRREGWLMRTFGRARQRRACALAGLEAMTRPDMVQLARLMRSHDRGDGFSRSSTGDICMHGGGLLRPHHTTNTMMAVLRPGREPGIAVTGTMTPCISLFRPAGFAGEWSVADPVLWERGADLHRRLDGDREERDRVRARIAIAEKRVLPLIESGEAVLAEEFVRAWDAHSLDAPAADSGKMDTEAPPG
jgi:hypothetical protein